MVGGRVGCPPEGCGELALLLPAAAGVVHSAVTPSAVEAPGGLCSTGPAMVRAAAKGAALGSCAGGNRVVEAAALGALQRAGLEGMNPERHPCDKDLFRRGSAQSNGYSFAAAPDALDVDGGLDGVRDVPIRHRWIHAEDGPEAAVWSGRLEWPDRRVEECPQAHETGQGLLRGDVSSNDVAPPVDPDLQDARQGVEEGAVILPHHVTEGEGPLLWLEEDR
ncbi:hypothetical protein V5799_014476 [Amblyomma americanum]|uniref:Uncharacterized protein n=1 Tax=Amblyomma americanum TaxID=6943 RepID=A0AAQ4E2X4_AMBAM